jgi:hypothetical protein
MPVRQFGFRGFRRYQMSEVENWLERRKNHVEPHSPGVPAEPRAATHGPRKMKRAQPASTA